MVIFKKDPYSPAILDLKANSYEFLKSVKRIKKITRILNLINEIQFFCLGVLEISETLKKIIFKMMIFCLSV